MQPPTLEQQWWPWQLIASSPASATAEVRHAYWTVQPAGRYLLLCRARPAAEDDWSAGIEGPFMEAGAAVARARAWCQERAIPPADRWAADSPKERAS